MIDLTWVTAEWLPFDIGRPLFQWSFVHSQAHLRF